MTRRVMNLLEEQEWNFPSKVFVAVLVPVEPVPGLGMTEKDVVTRP